MSVVLVVTKQWPICTNLSQLEIQKDKFSNFAKEKILGLIFKSTT